MTLWEHRFQHMLSQCLKYNPRMMSMHFLGLRVDQNIINKNKQDFIQHIPESPVHQVYKICWRIGWDERHNQSFIKLIRLVPSKVHSPLLPFIDKTLWQDLFEKIRDHHQANQKNHLSWVKDICSYSPLIELAVIHTKSWGTIRLSNKDSGYFQIQSTR